MPPISAVRIEFSIQVYPREFLDKPYFNHMIDGDLEIWLEDRLYFKEGYTALVEFALYLNKWLAHALHAQQAAQLTYYTLDHDEREGALLKLTPLNAEEYSVKSIWQKFECTQPVSHQAMKAAAESYLSKLDDAIKSHGDTSLNNLLAAYQQ